ncbi:SMP-30/gluconolactonase/LRE family protein [Halococcus agarilyticus]|uniref:SMP-30/gluconolactonase/LRE family protein n=1 Tax=Halococcus agarilyticus TaxID=1232219 RepID=UPI00226B26AE|nr:SMP-30/gluconolactonase/LRE family protein [Halococcus agarilyticus]
MNTPTRYNNHRSQLAECPMWHPMEDCLYWTDIDEQRLLRFPGKDGGVEVVCQDCLIGGFTLQSDGSLLLFMNHGTVGRYADGELQRGVFSLTGISGRFNDVVADPNGRVFCGTMSDADEPGQLYRLDRDGTFEQLLSRVHVPNGMGFSPDYEQLYVTETNNHLIHAFDYDVESGSITDRDTFADFRDSEGKPDGLTVDAKGRVWSAQWGSGDVACFTESGKLETRLSLPVINVTSVTFGGQELNQLFISTARSNSKPDHEGGHIFSVETVESGQTDHFSNVTTQSSGIF